MKTSLFDYDLPESAIAQTPAEPRDSSRLLVLHRATGEIEHRIFSDIGDYLQPGDLLVANNSRVIPARLFGRKTSGGKVELLLLRQLDEESQTWECLVRGRNIRAGTVIHLVGPSLENTGHGTGDLPTATMIGTDPSGIRHVRFSAPIAGRLHEIGEIPLPPYITAYTGDAERYQTVYSQPQGSVAAPTAGLHFTPELLLALRRRGVLFESVTLHVGLATFQPVAADEIEAHNIHTEWAELRPETAHRINQTSLNGGRIIAVGTTTVRTLEWAATGAQQVDPYDSGACPWQRTAAFTGEVNLFIRPGYRFRAVDALITNFHLPRSTLLMLVSAFIAQSYPNDPDIGRQLLLTAYEEAKTAGYRFYSFGDAMLIL
jgi:S-adenosylmethionine:tRNA ribosyltransferase-isomerase